ncbi:hypothetical protein SAMN05216276_101754 [Streptosporangium subroseum]|uniref:Uncharacterized protein n=1 Tax=Streptosporangium subroseum TaxID=106412 RepID=A0A239HNB5_9ACTN|nr:hypothetical protein SAMN05216276_101754 [Streptosporangium subroseum]
MDRPEHPIAVRLQLTAERIDQMPEGVGITRPRGIQKPCPWCVKCVVFERPPNLTHVDDPSTPDRTFVILRHGGPRTRVQSKQVRATSTEAIRAFRSGSMAPMTRSPCMFVTRNRARSAASRLSDSWPDACA